MFFRLVTTPIAGLSQPSFSHVVQRRKSARSRWSYVLTVFSTGDEPYPELKEDPLVTMFTHGGVSIVLG